MTTPALGCSSVTKTKYHDYSEKLHTYIDDKELIKKILNDFCTIMVFDPESKSKTPEYFKKQQEKRDKLKEQGISTWVSNGGKKTYEKKKLLKNEIITVIDSNTLAKSITLIIKNSEPV